MKKIAYLFMFIGYALTNGFIHAEPAPEPKPALFLYKTIPGDSLWNITERHLTNIKLWGELKKLNKLSDSNQIDPGTIIQIPDEWLKKNRTTATLVNTVGSVTITHPEGGTIDVNDALKQNSKIILLEGTHVQTGDDGLATILFVDGSRLLLQSNSELVLHDIIALGDGSLSDIKLQLNKGRIESRVHSSVISNTNYEVSTAVATTSVRGTDFRVTAGAGDKSIAEVISGQVIAANKAGSQAVELNEGEGTFIGAGDEVLAKLILPDPPQFDKFPKLIEHVPIKVAVNAIENITGFETAIVPVGDDPKNAISNQVSTGNLLMGSDIPDGRYQMFVSSIDEKGLTGKPAMYEFILNARPFSPIMDEPKSATALVEAKLQFAWNKVASEAAAYHLQVAKDAEFRDLVIDEMKLPEENFVPKERIGSGAYFWRIASIDGNAKRGPFTEAKDFRVLLETPNLQVANVATSDITLRWDESEAGTQYTIQVALDTDFKNIVLDKTINENTITLTSVKPETYYFRIQTIAPDTFVSAWGAPQKFVVPDNKETPIKVTLSN